VSHFNFAPYTGYRPPCDGKAQPGTKAMLAYLLDRFNWSASLGIYNCRPPSIHSDGRAFDQRIPTAAGGRARPELGLQVINLLGPHGARLGLQTLIYNRVIYSAASPDGRYYGGVHPHNDHVHGDQTINSGLYLTYATLEAVLGPVNAPLPAPTPPPGTELKVLEFGDRGPEVTHLQNLLNAHRNPSRPALETRSGIFGPKTLEELRLFQRAKGLKVDGIAGPATYRKLLNQ
jgi:hypothetical protein